MPGYILHLTEAVMVCDFLKAKGIDVSDKWKNEFFLGCLLPDTKRKTEKVSSHFWNPDTLKNLAIPPDLCIFEELYGEQMDSPLMLGYWMHLHLDYWYVKEFWDQIVEFRDEQGDTAVLKKDICKVWLKRKNIEIPVNEYFSEKYYYGDYSRMNDKLLEKYQIMIPKYVDNLQCPVKEVDTKDLQIVIEELYYLKNQSNKNKDQELRVFLLSELEKFIEKTAREALDEKILMIITGGSKL